MNRYLLKKLSFCSARFLATACLAVMSWPPADAAAEFVGFVISNPTPAVGSSVSVDLVIGDAVDLFAYNIDVGYDPIVLYVSSVAPGAFLSSSGQLTLSDLGLFWFDTSSDGIVGDISDSILGPVPGVSGGGVLATIVFDVLAAGASPLDFLNVGTLAGTELIDSQGGAINISAAPSATLTAVPIPAALPMLATALGLFLLLGKRKGVSRTA